MGTVVAVALVGGVVTVVASVADAVASEVEVEDTSNQGDPETWRNRLSNAKRGGRRGKHDVSHRNVMGNASKSVKNQNPSPCARLPYSRVTFLPDPRRINDPINGSHPRTRLAEAVQVFSTPCGEAL